MKSFSNKFAKVVELDLSNEKPLLELAAEFKRDGADPRVINVLSSTVLELFALHPGTSMLMLVSPPTREEILRHGSVLQAIVGSNKIAMMYNIGVDNVKE